MPSPAGFPAGEGRKRGGIILIVLRKMKNERFLVNHNQIECIELIPELRRGRILPPNREKKGYAL